MRVAIVTESFLPAVNGVTNSVLRVLEYLAAGGHEALVFAPGDGPQTYEGTRIVRTPSVPLPLAPEFPVGLPTRRLLAELEGFQPDVCHLASPVALAAQGALAAWRLGVPTVAVYQTDLAGFARRYRLSATAPLLWRWLRRVHRSVDLTLAPSQAALADLRAHGIPRVRYWPRGVDSTRFHPRHRDEGWRARHLRGRDLLVGYVGRLASEKRVHWLGVLGALDGVRVVAIGEGAARDRLVRRLPTVGFLGFLDGEELARAVASLDVLVHTGADETFCQAAQEALAAGVPVVAPDAGGITDLVEHNHNGLLWAHRDPGALRDAVALLAADPARRARYAAAARPSVVQRSWQTVGDQLIGHYRDVGRRSHARPEWKVLPARIA